MKSYSNLILSVVSLVLTTFLLVFVCLAWYSSNTTVHVNGVNGGVVDRSGLSPTITYYRVTFDESTNVYKINGDGITDLDGNPSLQMQPYDPLLSTRTEILVEITLDEDTTVQLDCITKASTYLGETIQDSTGAFVLKATGNSLTSVVNFSNVDMNVEDKTFQVVSNSEKKFFNMENAQLIGSSLELINTQTVGKKIYILLNYDAESIEHIYSLNIGNPALDSVDTAVSGISYKCDFYFTLEEVE